MGAATDGAEIVKLSKEHAELRPVAEAVEALAKLSAERADLEEMAGDPEMAAMVADEIQALDEKLPVMERELALMLAPRDKDENASAILEVRAGTGGDEAALFAGDLFRMYQRYAQLQGWKVEVDSVSEGEMGGYKEIIASVTGDGVFGRWTRCCPRPRTSRSRSTTATCGSTPTARPGPAASTSTRPTRPCASPTCRPAWW